MITSKFTIHINQLNLLNCTWTTWDKRSVFLFYRVYTYTVSQSKKHLPTPYLLFTGCHIIFARYALRSGNDYLPSKKNLFSQYTAQCSVFYLTTKFEVSIHFSQFSCTIIFILTSLSRITGNKNTHYRHAFTMIW